jgi:hypothetical protein
MSLRLEDMTWRCDLCRRERPDSKISVHKVDIGPVGLPAGTAVRNVKYCNDNHVCHQAALNWNEDEQRRRITS